MKPSVEGARVIRDLLRAPDAKQFRKETYKEALARRARDRAALVDVRRDQRLLRNAYATGCLLAAGSALVHVLIGDVLASVLSVGVAFLFWTQALRPTVRLHQLDEYLRLRKDDVPLPSFADFRRAHRWWVLKPLSFEP